LRQDRHDRRLHTGDDTRPSQETDEFANFSFTGKNFELSCQKWNVADVKDNPSRSQWSKIHLFGDSDPKFGGNGRGVFSFIDKDTEASVSVHAFILTHVLGNEDWMAAFRLDEDEDLLKWLKAKESNQDGVHNEMNVKVHFSYFTMSGVSEGWGGDCSYLQIRSISNMSLCNISLFKTTRTHTQQTMCQNGPS